MYDLSFEWDQNKERLNKSKHGIDFETAMLIWEGPIIQELDDRFEYDETRYIAYGEVDGRVLAVVYTWRDGSCRFISARMANRHERASYRQTVAGRSADDAD